MRLSTLPVPVFCTILALGLVIGCSDKGDDDGADETHAYTHTDTDSDADTDAHTDTGHPFYPFEGELDFSYTASDGIDCNAALALTGVSSPDYAGSCEDCEFVFQIEATVIQDEGNEACDLARFQPFTFYTGDPARTSFLAFASTYYHGRYDDVLYTGFGTPDEGYPGPYLNKILADKGSYSSSLYGAASFDGSTLAWTYYFSDDEEYYLIDEYHFDYYCSFMSISYATAAYEGELGGTEDLPCESTDFEPSHTIDTWEVSTDGGTVTFTADMVDAATTGTTAFFINDADGCTLFSAMYDFECTFPPLWGDCPSLEAELEAGTYTLVVETLGFCEGSLIEYDLQIGGDATDAVLMSDDLVRTESVYFTIDLAGSGTVSEAR